MSAGETRDIAIPAGSCGIPATARAYSMNVTVVPAGGLGYLSIWPAGQNRPLVSTLNSPLGRVVSNAALVPSGVSGAVSLFVTDNSHVILDLNGYFVPQDNALFFLTAEPCRVVDTRPGQGKTGQFGPPIMTSGTTRDFPIGSSGCLIPPSAQAYSLNATVVPSGPLSFLTLFPSSASRPLVSTLNSFDGRVVANAAIVPASTAADRAISAYVTDPTHLILDVNGYFKSATGASAELSFFPITPCRAVDTRPNQGKTGLFGPPFMNGGLTRDFPLQSSSCGIPSSAQAYALNITVVPRRPLSYLTISPAGFARPLVSTLNSFDGGIVANAAIVPAGVNNGVSVFVTDDTEVIVDVNGYFARAAAVGAGEVLSVQAAAEFSCALRSSGHLWCWGENGAAPLGFSAFGNGNTVSSAEPVLSGSGLLFDYFDLSPRDVEGACGISNDRAYCWGANFDGRLGDGTTNPSVGPVVVTGGHQFKAAAVGEEYTCALDLAGAAYCWGSSLRGRLGNGSAINAVQLAPVRVSGGLVFTKIDATTEGPTCALDAGGIAYCWGSGSSGALGNSSTSDATTPVAVHGGHSYTMISAGYEHFCAIDTGANAYCWGNNLSGQVGNDSVSPSVLAPALVAGGMKWSHISAGEYHSCGVTVSGDGYCWGEGEHGALGSGPTADTRRPLKVGGNLRWRMISAGAQHSCGLTVERNVYCWGDSGKGRVGSQIPNDTIATSPLLVRLP